MIVFDTMGRNRKIKHFNSIIVVSLNKLKTYIIKYKFTRILKKILKVLLWVLISILLLIVAIALIIQIPAVQRKIILEATSLISTKTHTKVEIKKIDILFPNSLTIEGLYLEDREKDTLLYAEKISVNILFGGLLKKKIDIRSMALENAILKINRTETDSVFNFSFLMQAFSDSTSSTQIKDKPEEKSKWSYIVDKVILKNTRFLFNDHYSGSLIGGNISYLRIKIDEIDLTSLHFVVDDILLENSNFSALIEESVNTKVEDPHSENMALSLSIKQLQINNSNIVYTDSVSKLLLTTKITHFKVKGVWVDLENELLELDELLFSKSNINLSRYGTTIPDSSDLKSSSTEGKSDWKVKAKSIKLVDNKIAMHVLNTPIHKNIFDANHLEVQQLSFVGSDFYYSAAQTKATIKNFTAVDQNNFSIKEFQIDFVMDKHSITANNFKVKTAHSLIDARLKIAFSSIDALMDSMPFVFVNAEINKVILKNSDINYFIPELAKQSFFKNDTYVTHISGIINGTLNDLKIDNLVINTGVNTIIKTDAYIVGLPDFKTAYFDFPNLTIQSGKKDITLFMDTLLPENIELPEKISLEIQFKGEMQAFRSNLKMNSSFGFAEIFATIDKSENFTGDVTFVNFDLGSLLKNKEIFGPVTLTAETKGHRLHKDTIQATIKAEVSQIYLNNYNYHNLNIDGKISGQEFGGKAGICSFTLQHEGKQYALDSILFSSINEKGKSEFNLSSSIIGIKYNGISSPFDLPKDINFFVNQYFAFSEQTLTLEGNNLHDFNFEIQINNHPILSEVFLPQLKEFESGIIKGSFDSQNNELSLHLPIKRVVYGNNEINDFIFDIKSEISALYYKISCSSVSNAQLKFENILIDGKLSDNTIFTTLSSLDNELNKKLLINTQTTKHEANYRITVDPKDFYLMNNQWEVAKDNYIEYGEQGVLVHNFFINNAESQLNVNSLHDQFNDDLKIEIKKFELRDISRIIEKDSGMVTGIVDGNILLKKIDNTLGIISDATISNLVIYQIPIGNLALKAESSSSEKFNLDIDLSGADNKLTAKGYFMPNAIDNSLDIQVAIHSLTMKTVEALSMGYLSESSGNLSGNFLINGTISAPDITGALTFNNVYVNPTILNNRIHLKQETILLKKDGFYFNSFTMLDTNQHTAVIDGNVRMNNFRDFNSSLTIISKDFLLFNSTAKDSKEFYGRMIIDSKITIDGPISLPVVNAKIKIKKGSNFTFAVPENKLTNYRGEDIIEFNNHLNNNSILVPETEAKTTKTNFGVTGFDISSIVEIDKEASIRILMDPSSSDSLVVKGDAAFSLVIDRSGKMSLTGAYNVNEGSYLVSLENVIKRKFTIKPGGTIVWNGELLDSEISIDAEYLVRASPIDLVANQMTDMSESSINEYKQRYPFIILLKLRGEMLHPLISFEIQLPPEEKGILGGAVNAKLSMLNQDPSALNKQVFALLILGRFIQENPLQSETSSASIVARTTVGRFLSTQLNQLSSKLITGVDLNFDIQSFNDYESGKAKGRTQMDVNIKKQLFKDRFSVQVGGMLEVEGEKAKQNSVADIISDVTAEFKITEDGRYRVRGFRHNKYEGVMEGELIEMGVGMVYVRDYNKLRELFSSPKKINDSTKINRNDSTNNK